MKNLCYNGGMKKVRKGFTLIEIMMFLAITALLFVGIIGGVQNSVNNQRYTDAVQDFANFLKNIYAEVENPQSEFVGGGRSELAIYGKLVEFGELEMNYDENTNYYTCGSSTSPASDIYVFNVIGKAEAGGASAACNASAKSCFVKSALGTGAEVAVSRVKDGMTEFYDGFETYTPRWQAKILDSNGHVMRAAVLITKEPKTNIVQTLVVEWGKNLSGNLTPENIGRTPLTYCDYPVNGYVTAYHKGDGSSYGFGTVALDELSKQLKTYLEAGPAGGIVSAAGSTVSAPLMEMEEINFCVDPFGDSSKYQNVRIEAGAHNSAAVRIIPLDSDDNKCNKS